MDTQIPRHRLLKKFLHAMGRGERGFFTASLGPSVATVKSERRRFAIQLSLFVAIFLAVWSLRATVFFALDEWIASPILRAAYADLLKLVLWILPAAVFVSRLRG